MSDFGGFLPGDGQGVFAPGRMIDAARARAGPLALDPLAEEGLHVLCDDLQGQATRFSFAGKKLLQAALIEALVKRRGLREPAVPRRAVFIVAPFRSGTTLLHRLLAEDARLRAPRTYEVSLAPVPARPTRASARRRPTCGESRNARPSLPGCTRWVRNCRRNALACSNPRSCRPASCSGRRSDAISAGWRHEGKRTGDAPTTSTPRACPAMGHGRWLMKSPVHMWGLSALLERFPDALVVQIHRERGDAVASFRKLVAAHHRIYRAEPDDAEAGDFAETVVHTGIARAAAARRDHGEDRFIDLSFETLVADPLSVVRGLWSRLDLPEDEAALARMARSLAA